MSETINIVSVLAEYNSLSEVIKGADKRKKELAGIIKNYATDKGVQDDKGSYYCDDDNFSYGSVAKNKITLDTEKATHLLQVKGIYDQATKVVLDEAKLEQLIIDGNVTEEEFESFMNTTTSYQVMVKSKTNIEALVLEEKPVVEDRVKPAKKKLPPLRKRGTR